MKHRSPYDLTEEEVRQRKNLFRLALRVYDEDHEGSRCISSIASTIGESRRAIFSLLEGLRALLCDTKTK